MAFEVVKFVATTRLRAKRDAGEATPAKDHEKGNRFAGCKRFPSFMIRYNKLRKKKET